MSIAAMGDGDAIRAAWAEVDHADRKAKAVCYRCACEHKNAGRDPDRFASPASFICLESPGWLLCNTCHINAMVAGWRTAPLDSEAGREALRAESE